MTHETQHNVSARAQPRARRQQNSAPGEKDDPVNSPRPEHWTRQCDGGRITTRNEAHVDEPGGGGR